VRTSSEGALVQVQCVDGSPTTLALSSRNPLFAVSRQTPQDHPLRRGYGTTEAEFIVDRLEAMLATARERAGARPFR
jgi:hypothetical protein